MRREVAREIFITPPRAVVANTPAPTGQAVMVPGGYRVTGRQGFSTGCRHATWVAAHCQVIDNGQVRMDAGPPQAAAPFLPAAAGGRRPRRRGGAGAGGGARARGGGVLFGRAGGRGRGAGGGGGGGRGG